ncbi:cytochrome c [Burkholderia sp. Ac-20365]|uniref:c-type cytochrome n=1 Tax=Burkholderia sp. Ac-20365 TaxID=2703897 RepID=UPI00197C5DCD|nr:cytochrome c [Burkholderia sp. Ac-20365]MBN3767255.1 c-type cytochrome [Burkholderia sp. Ac-20365]
MKRSDRHGGNLDATVFSASRRAALKSRRRVWKMAALAAAFSLFALYLAWLEAYDAEPHHNDESPLGEAVAQASAPANGVAGPGPDLVRRGEYLARAGDCIACHTSDKGRPFAGGLAISTPFGTIFTPNITPDPDTGIGRWTDADFLRAMHEGIRKDGQRLYPAFPYVEYTKVTDQDVQAIRAYLNTVVPVRYTPPPNDLRFPFNQRWLMIFWNLFNFDEGRFVPNPKQSAEWNRGAYLVEGLAHCGECHTPRNFTQGLKTSERLSGAIQAGWHAYNITPHKTSGIGEWSDQEIVDYLSTGIAQGRANAAGPMADVVSDSTQYLNREDLRSIATYLHSLKPVDRGEPRARAAWGSPASDAIALRGVRMDGVNGAQLFLANCASCHHWTGEGVGASAPGAYPSLIHNSVAGAGDANNLTMVILHGVRRTTKDADVLMPAFDGELSDAQIAALTNYVTKQFGNPQSTVSVEDVGRLRAIPQ